MKRYLSILCLSILAGPAMAEEQARIEIAMTTLGDRLLTFSIAVGVGPSVTGNRNPTLTSSEASVTVGSGDGTGETPETLDATPVPEGGSRSEGLYEGGVSFQSCILIDATDCAN